VPRKKAKIELMSDEEFAAMMAESRRERTPDEKRFAKMSWEILEAKFRYYILDDPQLSDSQYDKLEREYIALGIKLGEPEKRGLKDPCDLVPVDFPRNRPSSWLVEAKITGRDPSGYLDTLAKKFKA
jgi:hypothetical protein